MLSNEEEKQLKDIWEAASDFLLAEKNTSFADENKGLSHLKQRLVNAVTIYEAE